MKYVCIVLSGLAYELSGTGSFIQPYFSVTRWERQPRKGHYQNKKIQCTKKQGKKIVVQSLGTERCFLLVHHSLGILRKILEAVLSNMHFSDAAIRKESIMSAQKENGKFWSKKQRTKLLVLGMFWISRQCELLFPLLGSTLRPSLLPAFPKPWWPFLIAWENRDIKMSRGKQGHEKKSCGNSFTMLLSTSCS